MRNISILGMETVTASGVYDTIQIVGRGTCACETVEANRMTVSGHGTCTASGVNARIMAQSFSCSGMASLKLPFYSKTMQISGILTALQVEAEKLHASGTVKVEEAATIQQLDVSGVFSAHTLNTVHANVGGVVKVQGDVRGESFSVSGVLKAENIEAETFECTGKTVVTNQISVDKMKVKKGVIEAGEVVGDNIFIDSSLRLRKTGKSILKLYANVYGREAHCSVVDLIEATEIGLINVQAKQVNGLNVTIGAACVIDCVDCSGVLRIDESAKVGKIIGNETERI